MAYTFEEFEKDLGLCSRESEVEDTYKFIFAKETGVKVIKKGFTDGIIYAKDRILIQETKMLRDKNVTRCPFLAARVQALWYAFDDKELYVDGVINDSEKYFSHFMFKDYPDFSEDIYNLYKEVRSLASPSKAWSIPKVRERMKAWDSKYGFFNNVKIINNKLDVVSEIKNVLAA